MAKLGTMAWLDKTKGQINWRDKLALTAQGVKAKAQTRARLEAKVKWRCLEVDDILPPDTAICREAMALCETQSPPYMYHHALRAYFWARLLNDRQTPFDDEAVFSALMLHDMGLCDHLRLEHQTDKAAKAQTCFTYVGAKMAEGLALKHDWSERRALATANAISLHLNVSIEDEHGREAQLVRLGSGADVAGLGLDILHKDQIDEVTKRFPRLDMKRQITNTLLHEVNQRPCCRIAFLYQRLGFDRLIKSAPFLD
jgi:hypothetical protein